MSMYQCLRGLPEPVKKPLRSARDFYLRGRVTRAVKHDGKKALAAVKAILASSDKERMSHEFILQNVKLFGLLNEDWPAWGEYGSWRNKSNFGLLQYPSEFARFALFISGLGIGSAMEIGVFRGASSYFLAAVLQRANPALEYHMTDIEDKVEFFDVFSELLHLKKHIPATSDDFIGQEFDLVFIDADHSYDGVLRDFRNVGQYCGKAVAFHDIYGHEYDYLNGGTVRMWREFRRENGGVYEMHEFAECPAGMGLGLGLRRQAV